MFTVIQDYITCVDRFLIDNREHQTFGVFSIKVIKYGNRVGCPKN